MDAQSGKTFETINPATEQVLANVASCDKADVDVAVKAARAALEGDWGKLDGQGRAKLMHKLADLCDKYGDELSTIEVLDNGKPYGMYRNVDMVGVGQHLRYYAGFADKITGETFNKPGQVVCVFLFLLACLTLLSSSTRAKSRWECADRSFRGTFRCW